MSSELSTRAARDRIRAFLAAYGDRRGIDPEDIYGLDGGIAAGGTSLLASDLRALLAATEDTDPCQSTPPTAMTGAPAAATSPRTGATGASGALCDCGDYEAGVHHESPVLGPSVCCVCLDPWTCQGYLDQIEPA